MFKGKNYDLTIISHVEPLDIGIYAKPGYYFGYDNPDVQRDHRAAVDRRRTSTPTRRRWARRSTSSRTTASTSSCSSCRRSSIADANLTGPVEERADLRQRSLRAVLEVTEPSPPSPEAGSGAAASPVPVLTRAGARSGRPDRLNRPQ